MSNRSQYITLFLVIVMLALSGCKPTCEPGSLQAPEIISPAYASLEVANDVTLEWNYPADGCVPENFEITVYQNEPTSPVIHSEETAHTTRSVALPPLDENTNYVWHVRAKVGTEYSEGLNQWSSFFTEPLCTPADLVEPVLMVPDTGGIMYDNSPVLFWDFPSNNCIPEAYQVELSLVKDFSDIYLGFKTELPIKYKSIANQLQPATKYYWRVSAVVGNVIGPASLYKFFYTEPVCDVSDLVAPILVEPDPLATTDQLNTRFSWIDPYQNCFPDGFKLQVSEFEDMSTLVLDYNSPENYQNFIHFGTPFEDCKTYYWQVTPLSGGVEGIPSEVSSYSITQGDCPCDPAEIPLPHMSWPGDRYWYLNPEILGGVGPTLEWTNPGPCVPDGYEIYLSKDRSLTNDVFVGEVIGGDTTRLYVSPLEWASQYWWTAAGKVGNTVGDYRGPVSFFIGPECLEGAAVPAPVLLNPPNNAVLSHSYDFLIFEPGEPGCIPDGYLINLQTEPDFSGVNLADSFMLPTTIFNLANTLEDCETYYWKVTAIQDDILGTESEVYTFTMAEGDCEGKSATGKVNQNVWCKPGPDWGINSHLFENGDDVIVVGRNANSTQIQVSLPDENGNPKDPPEYCWIPLGAMVPFDYQNFPIKVPPDAPSSGGSSDGGSSGGGSTPVCYPFLGPTACKAAGGTPKMTGIGCYCP